MSRECPGSYTAHACRMSTIEIKIFSESEEDGGARAAAGDRPQMANYRQITMVDPDENLFNQPDLEEQV